MTPPRSAPQWSWPPDAAEGGNGAGLHERTEQDRNGHQAEDQAYRAMITAHQKGVCVVFTRDVAKATRATDAGMAEGYPLMFTTEPEGRGIFF